MTSRSDDDRGASREVGSLPGSWRAAYGPRMPLRPRAPARIRGLLALAALLPALAPPGTGEAAVTRGALDRPPYVDGRLKGPVRPAAHVAVAFRAGDPGSLDPTPGRSPALAAVLDSLREEIARLRLTTALAVGNGLEGGPDVGFGCRRGGTEPDGTPRSALEIDPGEPRRMAFEVEDARRSWRDAVRAAAGDSIRAILSVQLGFAEYWVRQKNWKGSKLIDLGVARAMPLPWLTSLDDPVQVLQLTAALVSPEGRVLRVGAEGLIARRTGMTASVLGAQEILTEAELESLTAPAADGSGPVWRSALRELITRMLDTRPAGS